jgi:hypothetical protein
MKIIVSLLILVTLFVGNSEQSQRGIYVKHFIMHGCSLLTFGVLDFKRCCRF